MTILVASLTSLWGGLAVRMWLVSSQGQLASKADMQAEFCLSLPEVNAQRLDVYCSQEDERRCSEASVLMTRQY